MASERVQREAGFAMSEQRESWEQRRHPIQVRQGTASASNNPWEGKPPIKSIGTDGDFALKEATIRLTQTPAAQLLRGEERQSSRPVRYAASRSETVPSLRYRSCRSVQSRNDVPGSIFQIPGGGSLQRVLRGSGTHASWLLDRAFHRG